MQHDNYLVIDLEATCCDSGTIPQGEMEMIEIGAVVADARSLQPVDEFGAFVRPVRHPILTEFCTALTSITQQQVDTARNIVRLLPFILAHDRQAAQLPSR